MKKIQASFYALDSGKEPVREWLLKLDGVDRQAIGKDIQKVEFGWPIGMPYCRPLDKGLYEVRSNISSGRIARVLFCNELPRSKLRGIKSYYSLNSPQGAGNVTRKGIQKNQMILLHGFIKKTQATPKHEMEIARKRMKGI